MKKLLLTSFAAIATFTGGAAIAADMPSKAPAPVVVRPACAQFGGFYLGGHVGGGSYNFSYEDRGNLVQTIDDDLPTSAKLTDGGFLGGIQGGYNWQTNCTVVGFEADWSWSNINAGATYLDGDGPGAEDAISVESRVKWFGTVRARGGIVVDNLLLYLTGGLAYGKFERTLTVFENAPATAATFEFDRTRWGWTLGAGAEWQWARNWSLKGEFLYLRFQNTDGSVTGLTINGINFGNPGRAYNISSQDDLWVGRLGVNYRF
jgi:outer membrane immunogenic protein